jgi:UDP-glucose 4-epimerase
VRYLVTGGCGFIGSHLCEALLARGDAVRVFDNLSSGFERNIAAIRDRVEFARGDVRDPVALGDAARGVDGVFHLAALVSVFASVERPRENHEVNLTGALNVLTAAREAGARRVVLSSSAAVYGNDPALPKREDMLPRPESPYALAKLAMEHYAAVFARLYGVQTVNLRYFNVYGPRQDPGSMYSGVISRFADAVRAGAAVTLHGDGLQTRDFVNVRDVVRANLAAMTAATVGQGEALNVGTGRGTSLRDLLTALEELTGRPIAVRQEPARAGDVRHSRGDIALAADRLGYAPACGLREGLRELLAVSGRLQGA